MKKHKLFVTISAEEQWINQIQAQGYRLIKVSPYTGGYTFEKVEQETDIPVVRLDYRQFASKQDYFEYLSLFAECGWTLIPGSRRGGYQYFTHTGNDGDTDIFSDDESRQALHKRVSKNAFLLFTISMTNFLSLHLLNSHHQQSIWNLKELYRPGLWERSGADFWIPFLIETPIVLFLRSLFPAFIILGAALFYLYMAYKNRPQKKY
ncbi:hypothetical protein BU202_04640 [Streptococcus cuniculi]|uniref:DUF2812 domain-containing protein n=1 Tax=Streptococcus cuniculi TaxID=1432788 RepID=A0A1Q8E916_9STRE|nr:DUF2812 domain-containing protein [Streptococcus cuniculi]OLF48285.1 hypothetical protein BU202_04640 [Streptococcus cuniculi]